MIRSLPSSLVPVVLAALLALAPHPAGSPARTVRVPAPPLALVDLSGRTVVLSDLRGSVVLVNFWTTWCPPCIQEMPSLQRAWQALEGDDFRMLAVAMGEDAHRVRAFSARMPAPLTFTLLPDHANVAARRWPMFGIPVTFLVDRSGCIAARVQGERTWDDETVLARIRMLLAEPASSGVDAGQGGCAGARIRL